MNSLQINGGNGELNRVPRFTLEECITVSGLTDGKVIGKVFDINQNGMGMLSSDELPINTLFSVRLIRTNNYNVKQFIDVTATVRWCKCNKNKTNYKIGLRFDGINAKSKMRLNTLINQFNNESRV